MADRKQDNPPTAQLDVDWLVGKRSDPRLALPPASSQDAKRASSNVVGAVLGLSVALLLLVSWPHLSQRWIAQHLSGSPYSLPNDSLETTLVTALDELQESSPETAWGGNWEVASTEELRGENRPSEDQHSDWHAILKFDQVAQPWVFEEESAPSAMNYKLSTIDSIAPVSERDPLRLAARIDTNASSMDHGFRFDPLGMGGQVHLPVIPAPNLDAVSSLPRSSLQPAEDEGLADNDTAANDSYASKGASMALVSSSGAKLGTDLQIQAHPAIASRPERGQLRPITDENPKRNAPQLLFQGNSVTKPKEAIRVEEQSLLVLFSLLSSEQERVVGQACEELSRRRVPSEAIRLAMSLARESEESKLPLLEEVVRLNSELSLPLLDWIARSTEFRTRQRAIAMIGATQDTGATQILRSLAQRESDPLLLQAIHKSLATRGNFRQSTNVGVQ